MGRDRLVQAVRWLLLTRAETTRVLAIANTPAIENVEPVHDPVTIDPAAVADLTTGTEPLHGTLLDWRWTDQEHGRWTALVRVRSAKALQYERWIDGEHLQRVQPPSPGVAPSAAPR